MMNEREAVDCLTRGEVGALEALVTRRASVTVDHLEGFRDPTKTIRGPWTFEFEAPGPWPSKSAIGEGRCTTRLTTLDPPKTSTLFPLGMLHKSSKGGFG